MMKWAGIGCFAVAGVLGGCGGSNDGTGSTGTAGSSGTTPAPTTKTCTKLPPLTLTASSKIGFVQIWERAPLWRTANTNSIVDEAKKRGYNLVYNPGTTDAAEEQVSRFQDLIDQKVAAIIVAPHDQTTISPMVVAARKACIPVFIEDRQVDTTVAIPGVDYVTNVGSDMVKEGQLAAQWLIKATGGTAKIIEFEGTVGASAATGRKQGFEGELKAYPGMQVLVSQSADFDPQTGHDVAVKLLPQYPQADWIFAHNDGMAFGVIKALQEMGKTPGKDIKIVSIDGTKDGAQDLKDGLIASITECNPKFGPLIFDTIEKYAKGETIPTALMNTDRVFDSTNVDAYLPEAF